MKNVPLQRESIEPRLDGIQKELKLLREFASVSFDEFNTDVMFDRAQLHLRFALEGMFHISSHILSRIPGGRFTEYKEVARKLGDVGIVSQDFAQKKLVPIAGYRNRLTHLYHELSPKELYNILCNDLTDIDTFVQAIQAVLQKPEKFGLSIE